MGSSILYLVVAILVFIAIYAGLWSLNHSRIRGYIEARGGETLDIRWKPFGAGWFGEKDSLIYQVRYRGRDGNIHEALCKTALLSGVYFSHDNIIHRPPPLREKSPSVRHDPSQTATQPPDAQGPVLRFALILALII